VAKHRMLRIIIDESANVAEFARRAEAWAATEANPPTDSVMAARWRAVRGGLSKAAVVGLIVHARSYRVARRDELFQTFIASVPTRKGKHQ
jgi:hypothetical protein